MDSFRGRVRGLSRQRRDRRGKLGEALDHRVGAKLGGGDLSVAVGHGNHRHAQAVGRRDVDIAVADHHRVSRLAADRADRGGEVLGVGFAHGQAVAAKHGAEETVEFEIAQEMAAGLDRFVGAHGHGRVLGRQRGQGFGNAWKGAAEVAEVGAIVAQEGLGPALDLGRRQRWTGLGETALDHAARPGAHGVADPLRRDRGASGLDQHRVERLRQVAGGIDEGAVEVEDNRRVPWSH